MKNNYCWFTLMLALVLALTPGAFSQKKDSPELMLGAALHQEEVEGNCKEAIKTYEKLVQEKNVPRNVAARAQLHIGTCEERLGQREARTAYETVTARYADQAEIVAEARRRLTANMLSSSGPAVRKLDGLDEMGSITPDGRRFVMADWSTGDLAIRDLASGPIRRLMAKAGEWKESNEEIAFSPKMSPDLRQVVYIWHQGSSRSKFGYQLRVTSTEPGAKPRVLIDNPEIPYYEPCAWSPDGKRILALLWKPDDSGQLAWVSAADGAVKVLRSLEWRVKEFSRPRLSPDGRYIAYSALERSAIDRTALQSSPAPSHIYILSADGSNETVLTKSNGRNEAPIWTPDGAHILFVSDRSGSMDLWSMPVRDGKPDGVPSLLKSEIGEIRTIGFSADGAYYYSHLRRDGDKNVFVANLDFTNGRLRGPLTLVTENGFNERPAWSLDGRFMAFYRRRVADGQESLDVVIHSLETAAEKTFSMRPAGVPMWLPDGNLLEAAQEQGKISFYRIDPKTGDLKHLVLTDSVRSRPLAVSPDGKTVYASVPGDDGLRWLSAIDLASGHEKLVFKSQAANVQTVALSPDGHTLALLIAATDRPRPQSRGKVSLVDVDGSNFRELYAGEPMELHLPDAPALPGLAWTKDGRAILFLRNIRDGWELMRLPVNGGKPESTGLTGKRMEGMDLSPDGSRIAFGDTDVRSAFEAAVLDNILPGLKTAK